MPIPLFLPHQLISPEFALSLVAPYKLPGLKDLIVHLGVLQSLGSRANSSVPFYLVKIVDCVWI